MAVLLIVFVENTLDICVTVITERSIRSGIAEMRIELIAKEVPQL